MMIFEEISILGQYDENGCPAGGSDDDDEVRVSSIENRIFEKNDLFQSSETEETDGKSLEHPPTSTALTHSTVDGRSQDCF